MLLGEFIIQLSKQEFAGGWGHFSHFLVMDVQQLYGIIGANGSTTHKKMGSIRSGINKYIKDKKVFKELIF